mgnify:CR=1 FL=1
MLPTLLLKQWIIAATVYTFPCCRLTYYYNIVIAAAQDANHRRVNTAAQPSLNPYIITFCYRVSSAETVWINLWSCNSYSSKTPQKN